MEMKRWSMVFSGLCLALVFSVSSVEAQHCGLCQKCDQDGDGIIRKSNFCERKCGTAEDEQDDDLTGACSGGDGGTAKYTVTLTVNVKGASDIDGWSSTQARNKIINLDAHSPHSNMPMTLDLNFYAQMTTEVGDWSKCFGMEDADPPIMTNLWDALIRQRNIKGGKQAEASWWFKGTNTLGEEYNYVLQMYGIFPKDTVWPGGVTLPMTYWEMNDASGNGETTQTACLGEGSFSTNIAVVD